MPGRLGHTVRVLGEVDSTQDALARMAREGAAEGTVVRARHQTGGRGRRGRSWWDAPGEALLFSVLLEPPARAADVPQLSLVAALAVAEALDGFLGRPAAIRWPNDVLVDGRKICGILPEAVAGSDGRVTRVSLGVGLNVNQIAFPAELEGRVTSLRAVTGGPHDLDRVLAAVLGALDRRYAEWCAGGFAGLRDAWRLRATMFGEAVRTADGREGVAVDVTDDGALLLDTGGGAIVPVRSGPLGERAAAGEKGARCCS